MAADADGIHVAKHVLVAGIADEISRAKRRVQRLSERPRVDVPALPGELSFDPVAELELCRRQLSVGAKRGPVALVLVAELPEGCAQTRQRAGSGA